MNKPYIYRRDFYCIDDFGGEEKWFEYLGFTIPYGYKCIKCIIEDKLENVLKHKNGVEGWIKDNLVKANISDFKVNKFENSEQLRNCIDHFFYDELSGDERYLNTINIDTPCGNYWSRWQLLE